MIFPLIPDSTANRAILSNRSQTVPCLVILQAADTAAITNPRPKIKIPSQSPENPTIFVVEGPKIEKMLGYTNLDSEKGFAFFQKFLKEGGILEELEKAGIQEGDTVRMYGFDFDYYK